MESNLFYRKYDLRDIIIQIVNTDLRLIPRLVGIMVGPKHAVDLCDALRTSGL